jgi:hypothetical protein
MPRADEVAVGKQRHLGSRPGAAFIRQPLQSRCLPRPTWAPPATRGQGRSSVNS